MADETPRSARSKALADSYAKSTAWLIEQHKDEFDQHRRTLLEAAGVKWSPPLTQEQKDRAALAELLERNPDLLDSVRAGKPSGVITPPTDPHS